MDSRTSSAIADLTQTVIELQQFQAESKAQLTVLSKEIASLKLKYANLRTPAVFELKDFEDELLKVEDKIAAIQQDVVEITADLVEFSNKVTKKIEKKK